MTICTGINPSDIPTVDLELLEISLTTRIDKDLKMWLEIQAELCRRRRAKSVELSSTEE